MDKTDESRRTTRRPRLSLAAIGSVAAAALLASACATDKAAADLTKPLPTSVAPGAAISAAVADVKVALDAGRIPQLPFKVTGWPNVTAGPDVIQAFKGGSVDLAANAFIPSIQAHAQNLDTRIVAVIVKSRPTQELATAPGSGIRSLKDLRGKKIAYSPGQTQGNVVLQTLRNEGLTPKDVDLVQLNSPQFLTALQGKQVDAAPLGEPTLTKYLTQYRSEGAVGLHTDAVDALSVLWAPTSALADDKKLSAITEFVKTWARTKVWEWEHPDQWIDDYYVKNQGVSAADGRRIVDSIERPYFPEDWGDAIKWGQQTIDLITASAGAFGGKSFDAAPLFDRRFEKVAADAVSAQYRTKPA
ncbi:ABC transporter substrate-binding protein [Tsukamurella sp. 8F]|uniref:ABC transporter substrate-binding protein n=1 Tax=unclassified Tsukamurella TaxID=2633480 RepID=UPI0023B9CD71|nr:MULTISPECIES: ABC transporter substrate-binding protein [unclassified Tsukamurella]MDF0529732.1 ABC transporter substrate-binding protein [Tsukamurella sp. 8J]MDF0586017.1 ABC transporter substrate-binding protein [Tsukamurella sp. 8F]